MDAGRIRHPVDFYLYQDKLPFLWCPGCGIGIVINSFVQAVDKKLPTRDHIAVASSGLSCAGKIPEVLTFLEIKITDDKLFRSAALYKRNNPEKKVVVFFSENDLLSSEGKDLLAVCEQKTNILAILINTFVYQIFIEHRKLVDVPFSASTSGNSDSPFNIPHLAASCGASYVARWTPLHCRRLKSSIQKALDKEGFSLIEVISPCLMYHASCGNLGKSLDRMGLFLKNTQILHNEPTENVDLRESPKIKVGNFIDR
ncbi:MAG: hypothetical protein JXB26_10745 [Candidatus Aminicenantes bacterium]|nr:hypothetical protein [Candidatus Aminicenantes bacterium]